MKKYARTGDKNAASPTNSMDLTSTDGARRDLLQNAALLGAGVAATLLVKPAAAQTAAPATAKPATAKDAAKPKMTAKAGDLAILNFAFLLERLELGFYSQAMAADAAKQYLHGRLHEIVPLIRDNEAAHVSALSAAITQFGGTPDTSARFRFPREVFISPITFARFAYTLEEIGIGAYLGAIGQIQSDALRAAAASIYGNETRHVALLRNIGGYTFSPRYYEGALSVAQVQSLIAPYVA